MQQHQQLGFRLAKHLVPSIQAVAPGGRWRRCIEQRGEAADLLPERLRFTMLRFHIHHRLRSNVQARLVKRTGTSSPPSSIGIPPADICRGLWIERAEMRSVAQSGQYCT